MTQRSGFNVAYRSHNIWHIPTKRSGVTYSIEYQCVVAAVWAGYRLDDFRELSGWTQSEIIAAFETSMQIASVLAEVAESKQASP